jgi:hypothetical protein
MAIFPFFPLLHKLANERFLSDPGATDAATANGMISLSFGKLFEKVRDIFLTWFIPGYLANH